jgi:hypothetical protein
MYFLCVHVIIDITTCLSLFCNLLTCGLIPKLLLFIFPFFYKSKSFIDSPSQKDYQGPDIINAWCLNYDKKY